MFKNLLKISGLSTAIAICAREALIAYWNLQDNKDNLKAVQNGEVRLMSEEFYKDSINLSRYIIGFNVFTAAGYSLGIYKTIQEIKK